MPEPRPSELRQAEGQKRTAIPPPSPQANRRALPDARDEESSARPRVEWGFLLDTSKSQANYRRAKERRATGASLPTSNNN